MVRLLLGTFAVVVFSGAALLGGEIKLVPEGRALYVEFALQPPLMLAATGTNNVSNHGFRTDGSGGRI
jgi:hypothetical protein